MITKRRSVGKPGTHAPGVRRWLWWPVAVVLLLQRVAGAVEKGTNAAGPPSAVSNAVPIESTPLPEPAAGTNRVAPEKPKPSAQSGQLPELESLQTRPGFRLEVVARAPTVGAPVAMAFDEQGRLFVAEVPGFTGETKGVPGTGLVRMLEDGDGDGVFDASTTLAEDLSSPAALVCYDGGVFVAATPALIYLKDSSGGGVANVHRVVFQGFGGTNEQAGEHIIRTLAWGPDHRIHGANPAPRSEITTSSGIVPLGRGGFSFDPRALDLQPETGVGAKSLAFDAWGRKFLSDFRTPILRPMYQQRYVDRNPLFAPGPGTSQVLGPGARVFPAMASVRTNGLPESPRRPASRAVSTNAEAILMTRAQGLCIYGGGLYPSNYFGNAFICDPEARVVHRVVLYPDSWIWRALRAPDEAGTEFIRSPDPLFRPVQAITGPEGALYVADARDGVHGRIYRVVPEGFKHQKTEGLGNASAEELVRGLVHPNGWQRDTAARLLYERRPPAAVALAAGMLEQSRAPAARWQALRGLAALGAVNERAVLGALGDKDARVREAGLRAAEALMPNGVVPEPVWRRIRAMGSDPDPAVRLQAAFTAGYARRADRAALLAEIAIRDPGNAWVKTAVLSSAHEGGEQVLAVLARNAPLAGSEVGRDLLREIAQVIALTTRVRSIVSVVEVVSEARLARSSAYPILSGLGQGMARTGMSWAVADPQAKLAGYFSGALSSCMAPGTGEPERLEALRVVATGPFPYEQTADVLLLLASSARNSRPVQTSVFNALGRYDDPRLETDLFARWKTIPSEARPLAVDALLSRTDRVPAIMSAIETGLIPASDVTPAQANFLRFFPEAGISQRAVRFFGPLETERPKAAEQFRSVAGASGSPSRGEQLYSIRCASCHHARHQGWRVGPDLDPVALAPSPKVLADILEPQKGIAPGFETCLLQTADGGLWTGVLERERPEAIVLARPWGERMVWPRGSVRYLQPQPWSLMPEGLEQGVSPQSMADLLSFLRQ